MQFLFPFIKCSELYSVSFISYDNFVAKELKYCFPFGKLHGSIYSFYERFKCALCASYIRSPVCPFLCTNASGDFIRRRCGHKIPTHIFCRIQCKITKAQQEQDYIYILTAPISWPQRPCVELCNENSKRIKRIENGLTLNSVFSIQNDDNNNNNFTLFI